MPPIVVKDMSRVFSSGVELYKKYKETRFVIGKEDFVNNTITKNIVKASTPYTSPLVGQSQ